MARTQLQLDRIYAERFSATEEYREKIWQILNRHWFQRWIQPNDSVVDFIDAYLPLSERSLSEALGTAGFKVETVIPRFLTYTMTGKKPSLVAVRPDVRLPLVWRIVGKQFFLVARKP